MRHLSREQAQLIDRLSLERYQIPTIVLMENAARSAAERVCDILDNDCVGQVLILCGPGNNGGDGLALARHLHNRGAEPHILLLTDPSHYKGDALANWNITQAMKIRAFSADPDKLASSRPMLIVDALFGTGLREAPRDPFSAVAAAAMSTGVPILSLDIPSALDADTGQALSPSTIRATHTITFVAAKKGFASPAAKGFLGEVTIGDIGCPKELIEEVLSHP
ncbi:MAG TPA: NAD(P)H-hydrate epimerase [Tepidisphaeraceae bacterium]|nr:NAD(P)H-hydrate epimerase [Tepidisphaeraceae bacterium]